MSHPYDRAYIQKQVNLYNTSLTTSSRADCLWRIANRRALFPVTELSPDGTLTADQTHRVVSWLLSEGFELDTNLFAIQFAI